METDRTLETGRRRLITWGLIAILIAALLWIVTGQLLDQGPAGARETGSAVSSGALAPEATRD